MCKKCRFFATSKNDRQGIIEVRIGDNTGTLIGTSAEIYTGGWGSYETYSASIDLTNYRVGDNITLVFTTTSGAVTGALFNLRTITFSEAEYTATVVEQTPLSPATECSTSAPLSANIALTENDLNYSNSGGLVDEGSNIGYIDAR